MRALSSLVLAASFSMLVACGGDKATDAPAAPEEAPAKVEATPAPETTPAAAPVASNPLALADGSSLSFVARKNDEADVAGSFTKLSGTMNVPGGDLSKATGNIEISWIGGVETADAARDNSIITVFFGGFDDASPKGQASLGSFELETPNLAVGASTTGNAFVDVGASLGMVGMAVPVTVTRDGENKYTVALDDGLTVSIDKLGLGERKATLMKICNHKSLGDAIKIAGTFVFGQ